MLSSPPSGANKNPEVNPEGWRIARRLSLKANDHEGLANNNLVLQEV